MEMFTTLLSITGKHTHTQQLTPQHRHIQAISSIFYDGFHIAITHNLKTKTTWSTLKQVEKVETYLNYKLDQRVHSGFLELYADMYVHRCWCLMSVRLHIHTFIYMGFSGGASGKELTSQCRRYERHGFDLRVRKIPWRRNGNPPQYSCLENPVHRGGWWATVHKVTQSQT